MPKRAAKKKSPPRMKARPGAGLEKALAKQKKEDLVKLLMEIALDDSRLLRRLELRFQVPKELIAATRQAISDATDFDEREMGYNFDYDYDAYETVKRNVRELVKGGRYREAMELSLELMGQGSYQVEMSDEGMMNEDIGECLNVVIKALAKSGLPAEEIRAWRREMASKDRVGFICRKELDALEKRFQD